MSGLSIQPVGAPEWRGACRRALDEGLRFCGAHAEGAGAERNWNALFAGGSSTRVLTMQVGPGEEADTIVDLVPAANWDEREAHDLYGLRFRGHKPLRPLIAHTPNTAGWSVPVEGDQAYQVAVGPIHAGVIESGHFRFHVVGERILVVDLRLFYKHRGLERATEGCEPVDGLAFAQRSCGACAVSNSIAYAQACEGALGLTSSRRLRRARTLLLELERLYSHINDIAAICAGVGFAAGNMAFAALKERAMRLNESLTGHRFLFDSIRVGGNQLEILTGTCERARGLLRELQRDAARAWREVSFSPSVQARLDGVGALRHEEATELGAVGPAARASGVRSDARSASPGLWYESSFAAAQPSNPSGDVAARLELRAIELEETFAMLDELFSEAVHRDVASPGGPKSPLGVARVESPRGETVCVVSADSRRIRRMRLRTGSYANWPALARATTGNLLPDFPLINKSFELCYACADR